MTDSLLLGVRDAARQLGIGRDTAYALARQGRLRSVRIGNRILIPRDELAAFVDREAARPELTPRRGTVGLRRSGRSA
jgi:excisionase family DNA binding protein